MNPSMSTRGVVCVSFFEYFLFLVVFVFHGFMFAVVNYVFPHYDVTRVTGVEVKRVDKDGPITKSNPADGPTRDVYFINTQNDDGKIMVYRNEDTRWGFPFYFKFGSANLQAEVQALGNENKLVQIKYYGWRMTMFDEYRNAVVSERNKRRCDTKPSDFILGILCLPITYPFPFYPICTWLVRQRKLKRYSILRARSCALTVNNNISN